MPLELHRTLCTLKPRNTILRVLLKPRLQHGLMEIVIIHSSNPGDQETRETGRDAIHQRAADGAKVVLHDITRLDGLALCELGELVAAADVGSLILANDEVGGEHGGGDFAAVVARADEGVD